MFGMDPDELLHYQMFTELELDEVCEERMAATKEEIREIADELNVLSISDYEIEQILKRIRKGR